MADKRIQPDDRSRMRAVMDNLILHLHPTRIPADTLRWTYTWGLGGLAALLLSILFLSGVILLNNYVPVVPDAYTSILRLEANVWFGQFLRSVHHWAANLLLVVAVLHLLRVFYTGAYRPPRGLNWILGLGLFLLVVLSNFTGYLLPWDQLAYWAVTVGTSILTYVPWIGAALSRFLLGGPEVGGQTLLNFYALHIALLPSGALVLMAYHFWRIRKDGGLTHPMASAKSPRVTTIPHLVRREALWAAIWLMALLLFAAFVPAPLEGIADPRVSPNPAKAPWYFLGLQELLLHFHPLVAAILLPSLGALALAALPWVDDDPSTVGAWFRSRRGAALTLLAAGLALLVTPLWVLLDEYILHWTAWLPSWPTLISNGLIPLSVAFLPIFWLDDVLQKRLGARREERVLFFFTLFFVAFVVLTVIGIFFRGAGMMLYWPWDMPVVH